MIVVSIVLARESIMALVERKAQGKGTIGVLE